MESVIKRQKLMRQMGECIKGTSGHQPSVGGESRAPPPPLQVSILHLPA